MQNNLTNKDYKKIYKMGNNKYTRIDRDNYVMWDRVRTLVSELSIILIAGMVIVLCVYWFTASTSADTMSCLASVSDRGCI